MFIYNGKIINSVGFLGFGKSNIGVFEYLNRHYAGLVFTLRCEKPDGIDCLSFKYTYFGNDSLKNIKEDILFLSPSVRRDKPELICAEARGVVLTSDAEFFFSLTDADVYAVTGSDGKSTTTYLTSRLLSSAYPKCFPSGNIGEAMTPHLDDKRGTAHVTELSSFQLSYLKPKTKRAVITNVTENHLNWHKSFDEYIDAKKNVFFFSEQRVVNFDCPITRRLARDFKVFAVFSKNSDEKLLRSEIHADLYVTLSDGFITALGEPMLDTRKIRVGGEYNVLNFMAAIALSFGKCRKEDVLNLAESFGGLKHRCELVHEVGGIRFFDSSIDSSPKRCIATLNSFSERVILILGGRSKGLDFKELMPTLSKKTKRLILTGECRKEIINVLENDRDFSALGIPFDEIENFEDAVNFAANSAVCGDSVLLSPAATSYDSFKSFEERGELYTETVKKFRKYRR